jgi:hypothetical protein
LVLGGQRVENRVGELPTLGEVKFTEDENVVFAGQDTEVELGSAGSSVDVAPRFVTEAAQLGGDSALQCLVETGGTDREPNRVEGLTGRSPLTHAIRADRVVLLLGENRGADELLASSSLSRPHTSMLDGSLEPERAVVWVVLSPGPEVVAPSTTSVVFVFRAALPLFPPPHAGSTRTTTSDPKVSALRIPTPTVGAQSRTIARQQATTHRRVGPVGHIGAVPTR